MRNEKFAIKFVPRVSQFKSIRAICFLADIVIEDRPAPIFHIASQRKTNSWHDCSQLDGSTRWPSIGDEFISFVFTRCIRRKVSTINIYSSREKAASFWSARINDAETDVANRRRRKNSVEGVEAGQKRHVAGKFQGVNSITSHSAQLILLPSYATCMYQPFDIGRL